MEMNIFQKNQIKICGEIEKDILQTTSRNVCFQFFNGKLKWSTSV